MTVNEAYELMLYATAKNKQNGYLSPNDFDTSFNIAQKSYASYLLGSFNTYMQGRPIARVELGNNQNVRQRLSPIIYGYNLNVDSSGYSPYPGDFLNVDAVWSYYGYNRIRYVQQDSLWSYYNSVIDPYQTNPFYLVEDTGFRFFPDSISAAKLSYVRNPPNVVWGYTEDSNGRPVYSEVRSTQPVWDDASMFEIIVRALAIVGVNLQLNVGIGYSQQIKTQGQ